MRGTATGRVSRWRQIELTFDRLRWQEWDNAEPVIAEPLTREQMEEVRQRHEEWYAEWERVVELVESQVSSCPLP